MTEEPQLPEDVLNIMIASDIHLGHDENDPILGKDSFTTFEEVLSLSVEYDVDFILLGGDLFDHAKPTPSCMLQCTELIRKFCFGDKPIAMEMLSDQVANFGRCVNYEDPNINVSYPIMSIHGNHDDPVGRDSVSSLDILSKMGLVNYFGVWNDYSEVRVSPILLQKGRTRLALYGLSHLKDQRLSRLFKESKVEMERPDDADQWFHLLTLHQNRADRGPGNYIPEDVLPDFLDLVVWGHEHDCRVREELNTKRNFYVCQPGSTVVTSLASGEALQKHCALLQVHRNKFKLTPVPLKTVRPFIFRTVVLSEEDTGNSTVNESEKVQELLKQKVLEAIEEANEMRSGHERQPNLPLVRLNVIYDHEGQDFNRVRFGQQFDRLIANPHDVLLMKRQKKWQERQEKRTDAENHTTGDGIDGYGDEADVETLLQRYFDKQTQEGSLTVLSIRAMAEAVKDFTLKKNDETFRKVFEAHKKHCIDFLLNTTADNKEDVAEQLSICKGQLDATDSNQLKSMIQNVRLENNSPVNSDIEEVLMKEDPEPVPVTRSRGRGSRGGSRSSRSKAQSNNVESSQKSESRTPRRNATQKAPNWLQDFVSSRSTRQSTRRRDTIEIEDSD